MRVRVLALCAGREEAAHHLAVDRVHREGLRDAEHPNPRSAFAQRVPDAGIAERICIRDGHAIVRVVRSVPESVEAELARVATGRHRCPRGNGDRGNRAVHAAPRPIVHQPAQGGEVITPEIEHQLGRRAVKPDDHHAPSVAGSDSSSRPSRQTTLRSSVPPSGGPGSGDQYAVGGPDASRRGSARRGSLAARRSSGSAVARAPIAASNDVRRIIAAACTLRRWRCVRAPPVRVTPTIRSRSAARERRATRSSGRGSGSHPAAGPRGG